MLESIKKALKGNTALPTNWNDKEVEASEAAIYEFSLNDKKRMLPSEPSPLMRVDCPVKKGKITSSFGPRNLFIDGKKVFDNHKGIDLVSEVGTDIFAPENITIKKAVGPDKSFPCKFVKDPKRGWIRATPPEGKKWEDGGWAWTPYFTAIGKTTGNLYVFRHSVLTVKIGAEVNQGEKIGKFDNLGYSMGVHLHFEIMPMVKGSWPECVDPKPLIKI